MKCGFDGQVRLIGNLGHDPPPFAGTHEIPGRFGGSQSQSRVRETAIVRDEVVFPTTMQYAALVRLVCGYGQNLSEETAPISSESGPKSGTPGR
jgi:hypothetical protein